MHAVKVIKLQILKQVAEVRGQDVKTIRLHRYLPATVLTDFLIGQFLMSPLVTMCWRSTWILADITLEYFIPSTNNTTGILFSLSSGTCLTILLRFIILVPSLSSMPSLAHFIFSRVFTIIYFCCYMLLWRGWWALLTYINAHNMLVLLLGIFVLFISSSLATNVGAPLSVSHDSR